MTKKLTMPGFLRDSLYGKVSGSFPFIPPFDRYSITVCQEKKFIWYRVAKVGTRTIYDMLENAGVQLINEQVKFYSSPANRYPGYFKFAFVRNPWDRLVSCWKDKVVSYNYFRFSDADRSKLKDFANFVAFLEGVNIDHCDPHLRSQSKLVDVNNLDYLGHFENFSSSLHTVSQRLDLGKIRVRKLNASDNRKNYRNFYTEAVKQKVASIYREDIEVFSYNF